MEKFYSQVSIAASNHKANRLIDEEVKFHAWSAASNVFCTR
jgi:hypothetical protein